MSTSGTRPLRADARRNRERLLEVAVAAFSSDGDATLESIAKAAGVGIGTLYRHFPTREALIEATYRHELDRLCDSVPALLDELEPEQAFRAWLDRFIDYLNTKHGMADALRAVIASGGDPFKHSRDRLVGAMTTLLDAAAKAGVFRTDITAIDLLMALSGLSLAGGDPEQRERTDRLINLLVDGLRYRPLADS